MENLLEKYKIHFSQGKEKKSSEYLEKLLMDWNSGEEKFTLQTSGTTGKPRKITFDRQQLLKSAEATIRTFALQKKDLLFSPLSIDHVAGFMMVIRALALEADLKISLPSLLPFEDDDLEKNYAFAPFVPAQFQAIMEHGKYVPVLESMRSIIIGGSPVSDGFVHLAQSLKTPIYHTYGMTETLTHVAVRKLNGDDADPYFRPLQGVSLEKDHRGCLVINTPWIKEAVTTNDVAEIFENNLFRILGRWDNVINTGGEKVYPEQLEKIISPLVSRVFNSQTEFFIAGIPDAQFGEKVALVIKVKDIDEFQKEVLRKKLREILEKGELPRIIARKESFPKLKSGKIDKTTVLESLDNREKL